MFAIPRCTRITAPEDLTHYATHYEKHSGLPVPMDYLARPGNRVYVIRYRGQVVGGFILGRGNTLRTLEIFARSDERRTLYERLGSPADFTEITCFWIAPAYRVHSRINTAVWVYLAFRLKRQEQPKVLFGTCSARLASLYGVTPKSRLIHRDQVNKKRTFIFQSERRFCLSGFWEILRYKWYRMKQIHHSRGRQGGTPSPVTTTNSIG